MSPIISSVTSATLGTPEVVWASAIEPAGIGTNMDPRVEAMALSEDGTTVIDTTLLERGVLTSASELGYPHSSLGAADAPSPRAGFTTVFSRRAGGVFVIGGTDAVTGRCSATSTCFGPTSAGRRSSRARSSRA